MSASQPVGLMDLWVYVCVCVLVSVTVSGCCRNNGVCVLRCSFNLLT